MANTDFFTQFYPYASRVSSMTGLDPRLVLAQAALETGFGRSAPGQNFFGIKGGSGPGLMTTEFIGGQPVRMRESFRSYGGPEESFLDYANLMMTPRYSDVRSAQTLEDQASALQRAGYATDPEYASKLIQIAGTIPRGASRRIADETMQFLGSTRPEEIDMDNLRGFSPVPDQSAAQPAGLLPQPARRPSIWSDPETWESIALALNPLRTNPDENLAKQIEGRRALRTDERRRNMTAQWLRSQGMTQYADLVEGGMMAGDEALRMAMTPAESDATALQRNYEFLVSQGFSPEKALEMLRTGTTISMPGAPTIGTIPTGYQAIQDPVTGAYRFERIPGGPAEAEAVAAEAKEGVQAERATTAANIVLQDIGRIQKILRESSFFPVTGTVGSLLKNIPGTNAYDVRELTSTIRANIGFERLEQMRQASPTGGALGQVTERELAFLQSVLGSLEQGQTQEQFEFNLRRLNEVYTDVMRKFAAYPNASEFGIAPIPETPPDFSSMTDEELEAYIAGQSGNQGQQNGI